MGTEFHGITKDEMKFGDSLNFIRYQVYNLCKEADVILTVAPEGDFDSLCYLASDYNNIRHKVIDLGLLLSPRKDGNPIALKYLSYSLLQTNIQSEVHSSLSDCLATLKLFHLAPNFIMKRFQDARKRGSVARRKNLFGYLYEPCKEISYSLKTFSSQREYWPLELLNIHERRKKKSKRIFSEIEFVEPVNGPFIVP